MEWTMEEQRQLAGPKFSSRRMSNPEEYQQDKDLAGPKFSSRATFTPEDLDAAMKEAAKRGADEALSRQQTQQPQQLPQYQPPPQYTQPQYQPPQYQSNQEPTNSQQQTKSKKQSENEEEENLLGVNSKFIKSLQNTVGVFNALKEFATNPLQKAIEQRVGDVAAQVVENAFAPRGPPPKRDIIDTILNSQFAYGLGAGLGQRAPELVDTMTKNFGPNKAEEIIDNMMGKYGKGGGGGESKQIGSGTVAGTGGTSGQSGTGGSGSKTESGGISGNGESQKSEQSNIELLLSLDPNNPEHVAAYAESQGGISVDVARKMLMIHQDDIIKKMSPQEAATKNLTQPPRQSEPQVSSPSPVATNPVSNPAGNPLNPVNPLMQPGQEYTEFNDVPRGATNTNKNIDNQQTEFLKVFSEEIGKVMGDMVTKIESLNNTVSTLQTELDSIKKDNMARPPYPVAQPVPSQITQPGMIGPSMTPNGMPRPQYIATAPGMQPVDNIYNQALPPRPMSPQDIINASSEDYFGEHLQSMTDFKKELEEESNTIKRELEKKEKIVLEKIEEKIEDIKEKEILDTEASPEILTETLGQEKIDTTPEIIEQEKIEDIKEKEILDTEASPEILTETLGQEKIEEIIQGEQKDNTNKEQIIDDNKDIHKPDIPIMEEPTKEEVKFVTPIKRSDVYKKFSPSLKKSEDNKG